MPLTPQMPLSYVPLDPSESIHVYLNGVEQFEPDDWQYGSAGTIKVQPAMDAQAGDLLEARYAHAGVVTGAYLQQWIDYNPSGCPGAGDIFGVDGHFDKPYGPVRSRFTGFVYGSQTGNQTGRFERILYDDTNVTGYWRSPVGCIYPKFNGSGEGYPSPEQDWLMIAPTLGESGLPPSDWTLVRIVTRSISGFFGVQHITFDEGGL